MIREAWSTSTRDCARTRHSPRVTAVAAAHVLDYQGSM